MIYGLRDYVKFAGIPNLIENMASYNYLIAHHDPSCVDKKNCVLLQFRCDSATIFMLGAH
jgi:hypothetical protein